MIGLFGRYFETLVLKLGESMFWNSSNCIVHIVLGFLFCCWDSGEIDSESCSYDYSFH